MAFMRVAAIGQANYSSHRHYFQLGRSTRHQLNPVKDMRFGDYGKKVDVGALVPFGFKTVVEFHPSSGLPFLR